jgi:hypothetical protein
LILPENQELGAVPNCPLLWDQAGYTPQDLLHHALGQKLMFSNEIKLNVINNINTFIEMGQEGMHLSYQIFSKNKYSLYLGFVVIPDNKVFVGQARWSE